MFVLSLMLFSQFTNAQPSPCGTASIQLACGDSYFGDTSLEVNALNGDDYGCNNTYDYNGKEARFRVDVPAGTKLTIELDGMSDDLDLIVYHNACTPDACVEISANGGTTADRVELAGAAGTYYIIVDAFAEGIESTYALHLNCGQDCITFTDSNCDDMEIRHQGGYHPLQYNFRNKTGVSGTWTVQQSGVNTSSIATIGSGTNVSYQFSGEGEYTICQDLGAARCNIQCCKTVYAYDPNTCFDISEMTNSTINLFTNAGQTTTAWLDEDTGAYLDYNTNGISLPLLSTGECRTITAYLYDELTNCHRLCTKKVCGSLCAEVDTHCDDLAYAYAGTSAGELRYYFSVSSTQPNGYWQTTRMDGTTPSDIYEQQFGNSLSITHTFPKAGTYVVCYIYTDSNGCEVICSKNILVKNPYDCTYIEQVTLLLEDENDKARFMWNEQAATFPQVWNNVSTDQQIATFATEVRVDYPAAGTCHEIEVMYFDTVCARYAVCRTELCGFTDDYGICNEDIENTYWLRNLKNNLSTNCGIDEWTGASIKYGRLDGECVYIGVIYGFDSVTEILYDKEGIKICEANNYLGLYCDKLANITEEKVIWKCEETAPSVCAELSTGAVTCLGNGIYDYTFKLKNNTTEAIASNFFVMDAGISFEECTNALSFLTLPGQEDEISFAFEHCFGNITEGDTVTLYAQFFDENDRLCTAEVFDVILTCSDTDDGDDVPLCSGAGNNLIQNGDFEIGNQLFTSALSPACNCAEDTYCLGPNANLKCSNLPSHTMDNQFLIVEKSATTDAHIWYQSVPVEQGKTYAFTFDVLGFTNAPNTNLKIAMGADIIKTVNTKAGQNIRVGAKWTATYTGDINVQIVHRDLTFDEPFAFGIDNIEFVACSAGSAAGVSAYSSNTAPTASAANAKISALQNAPNPFSSFTMIQFEAATESKGTFRVRDLNGRVLHSREAVFHTGENSIEFHADALPAGTYIYEIETADFLERKKMIVQ